MGSGLLKNDDGGGGVEKRYAVHSLAGAITAYRFSTTPTPSWFFNTAPPVQVPLPVTPTRTSALAAPAKYPTPRSIPARAWRCRIDPDDRSNATSAKRA